MARVTVEDSLKMAKNRFALVLLSAARVKQLFRGSKPLCSKRGNREVVTSLREIAEGKVAYARPENLGLASIEANYIESGKDVKE